MQTHFNRLSKPELEYLKNNCSFSEEEYILLSMSARNFSDIQIALQLNISISSVRFKKKKIKTKIFDFLEVSEFMTIAYINGKEISPDEIKKMELKNEQIKKIIQGKLTGKLTAIK